MMRAMSSRSLLFACALALLGGSAAHARDVERSSGPTPAKNFSNIHADVDWVVKAFSAAEAAREQRDWGLAVRTLQELVDRATSRESPGDAAPYVRAVYGSAVYEGAWIVARHRVAAWGTTALEHYAREYGAAARKLLERALARHDTELLTDVATRFLPLAEGRRAALLLIDLALERSDVDAAMGWIEALEDLEAVSAEAEDVLAPWRAARVARQAMAIARSPELIPQVRKILAATNPREGLDIDAVGPELMRRPAPPRTWPTTGGNAARAALPASLGAKFELAWFKGPAGGADLIDSMDPAPPAHDRPSIWLPPRAVATDEHLLVSDGQYLHIYGLADGKRVLPRGAGRYPRGRRAGHGQDSRVDRRKLYGLLEGHTLTVHPVTDFTGRGFDGETIHRAGRGWLVLAAVPDGYDWLVQRVASQRERRRNDHIQAYHWDGLRLTALWRVGGTPLNSDRRRLREAGLSGLPADTRLYGAPLLYRGRVWVAGVRPSRATSDRWEAWIYGIDPSTGRVETRTHLGTGTAMRKGRMDEVIPTSPAAAHGRIVVGTALGILGAVDARDGRVQWIYRYDRDVETERGRRRNRNRRDEGSRPTSFFNEPPILALDRCFVTPTDGKKILVLFNRPRTARRSMLNAAAVPRDQASSKFMAEHIAGVVPGEKDRASDLLLVGQGESGPHSGPIVVSLLANDGALDWPMDPERDLLWREESVTGFGNEPYGRALVTTREVFVPTAHGIVIYEIHDRDENGSHYLGILNRDDIPKEMTDAPKRPYGNLIPIPGRGIVSVSATTIAFWKRKP